ncbi:HalOD1 output domain-containing protein [Haloprofundus salinisoli]|uniref:HalOD1 output domain-containing protein n=1 Tax=Haloprofundus salinisoli TaxID=2876193 RepID=UPI001CCB3407|nr:HalOD1 output domain-containing protein [Haloprofundus salinisoli]
MSVGSPSRNQGLPPLHEIVTQIATREGVGPLDLPPLHYAIDPNIVPSLLESPDRNGSRGEITFTYFGYDVTVTEEGMVQVTEKKKTLFSGV